VDSHVVIAGVATPVLCCMRARCVQWHARAGVHAGAACCWYGAPVRWYPMIAWLLREVTCVHCSGAFVDGVLQDASIAARWRPSEAAVLNRTARSRWLVLRTQHQALHINGMPIRMHPGTLRQTPKQQTTALVQAKRLIHRGSSTSSGSGSSGSSSSSSSSGSSSCSKAHQQRLLEVPGAHDTRQQVVSHPIGHFREGVGGKGGYHKHVRPPALNTRRVTCSVEECKHACRGASNIWVAVAIRSS
jgi:hypothetical protein